MPVRAGPTCWLVAVSVLLASVSARASSSGSSFSRFAVPFSSTSWRLNGTDVRASGIVWTCPLPAGVTAR